MNKIILSSIILVLGSFIIINSNSTLKEKIKYQVLYSDYLEWKKLGGPMLDKYAVPFKLDSDKSSMINNLSHEEIVEKFPFLIDGETYSGKTYKSTYLNNLKQKYPDIKLLWFSKEDGFDWCIQVSKDFNKIVMVKG